MNLPIATLTELARTRTQAAARKLSALQAADMDARQKLQVLLQYRAEYDQHVSQLMRQGCNMAQLRNFHLFLQRLDEGIARQRLALEQAHTRLDDGRQLWQQDRRQLNAFETLAQRLQRRELVAQNRREQRGNDEHAARGAINRVAA